VIVVADTSVLINLCRVGQGGLLTSLFFDVVIPPAVAAEFVALTISAPRFSGLDLPAGIREQSPVTLLPAVLGAKGIDAGEAAALSLAVEIRADAILIDERLGHEIALRLGLNTIGLSGILLRAKAVGILPQIAPVIEALERDAGFWISEKLRAKVLELAGETT
jgi:uncharacterized protein